MSDYRELLEDDEFLIKLFEFHIKKKGMDLDAAKFDYVEDEIRYKVIYNVRHYDIIIDINICGDEIDKLLMSHEIYVAND